MTEPVRLWPCGSSFGVEGAEELGESFTCGICGRLKFGDLVSRGRITGEELPESVPEPARLLVMPTSRMNAN